MGTPTRSGSLAARQLEHQGVKELRLSALAPPVPGGQPLETALQGLLEQVPAALAAAGMTPGDAVRCTVFCVAGTTDREVERRLAELHAALRSSLAGMGAQPAVAIVQQPPLGGGPVALELTAARAAAGAPTEVPRAQRLTERCTVFCQGSLRRAFVALATTCTQPPDGDPRQGWRDIAGEGIAALEQAEEELQQAGFGLDQVCRTWFYVPGILVQQGDVQRYQQLNDARAAFFDRPRPHHLLARLLPPGWASPGGAGGYPASTGIGVSAGPLVVELEALDAPPGAALAFPIENPQQRPAFDYPRDVLVGAGELATPRFSRGLVEVAGGLARVRVSGTASIHGSRTLHPGDAASQTATTLELIELLVSQENLARYGLGRGLALAELAQLRVYVKQPEDLPRVRRICEKRCGDALPVLYVQADVCRADLLVEIEAYGAFPCEDAAAVHPAVVQGRPPRTVG